MAKRLPPTIRSIVVPKNRRGRARPPKRHVLLICTGAILVLAACKGGDTVASLPVPVPGGAGTFGSYFVQSFDPYEAVATALRDTTARYLFQRTEWRFSAAPDTTY